MFGTRSCSSSFRRQHLRLGVEAPLNRIIEQQVARRQQAHPLVVRHPRPDHFPRQHTGGRRNPYRPDHPNSSMHRQHRRRRIGQRQKRLEYGWKSQAPAGPPASSPDQEHQQQNHVASLRARANWECPRARLARNRAIWTAARSDRVPSRIHNAGIRYSNIVPVQETIMHTIACSPAK